MDATPSNVTAIGATRQREMAAYDRLTPRLRRLLQNLMWNIDPSQVEQVLKGSGEDAAARWAVQRSARLARAAT